MHKILRTWTFWIRTELREECRAHLEATKLQEMRAASGNQRAAALFRDREDGTTVVIVMSVWDSMDSVRAFSPDNPDAPSIEPADRLKLFDGEPAVRHYSITGADAQALLPLAWREGRGSGLN